MDKLELEKIVSKHGKWLRNEEDGEQANLKNANLRGADPRSANLEDAELPITTNVANLFTKIKAAIKNDGKLEMGAWHVCKTTHCLAGWVTTIAGEGGAWGREFSRFLLGCYFDY